MKASSAAMAGPRPLYPYVAREEEEERERRFQDSIGYTLATEGGHSNMGAAGGLQIWPKLQAEPYQHTPDMDKGRFNRLPSDSIGSYNDPFYASPARRRPTLHAAVSQPDLHSSARKDSVKTDAGLPPPIPQSHHQRSHKVDFTKIFSRHKSKNKDKNQKPSPSHTPSPPLPLPPPPPVPAATRPRQGSDISSLRPASAGTSGHRTHATVFDRNPTENAKINVRRPPKGIKHWFEGLDSSDDDFPEVVTPAETPQNTAFRPSLGPGRSRVAPTSRVSPAREGTDDYFHFHAQKHQNNHAHTANLQDRSMLNLSSDDEEEEDQFEVPSPPRWSDRSTVTSGPTSDSVSWSKSAATRQSTFSMQTTMTSGSIPIINADSLEMAYRTPLPPLPSQYQPFSDASAVPAPLRKQKSYHFSSPGRTRATSTSSTMKSGTSASTTGQSHVMAVTQEEMALLEMMRRKRAEMQSQVTHPARRQDQSRHVSPYERKSSVARSHTSSTLSHNSARSIGLMLDAPEGTAFPAPPSSRIVHETDNMNYFTIDDKRTTRSSDASSTPHSSMLAELEAPTEQLQALCFEKPRKSESQPKLVPFENSSDPYRLAPDLELSSIDLLPLPARTYSPSLAGTCSSAMTPEFGNHGVTGFTVAGSENGSEADRYRNSVKTIDSADLDVLAAWGRLGGQ